MGGKLHRQIRKSILVLKRCENAEENPHKMTVGERNVFLCLSLPASDIDGTGIYCKIGFLQEVTGLSRVWIQKCLRRLERKGYIVPALPIVGGRGRPTSYYIPLNEFGIITPKPPPEEEESSFLDLDTTDQAPPPAPSPRLPAIPETPVPTPGNLPMVIGSQALVALEIGTDLHKIGETYIELIQLQAREVVEDGGKRYRTKKWDDYQRLLKRARDGYNQALETAGVQASDGHSPPIDDELEQQLQEWSGRAYIHESWRDLFAIGSEKWSRWHVEREKDLETFGSLLYHIIQITEEGIPI